jgi:lysophospholipase L1-like esterase
MYAAGTLTSTAIVNGNPIGKVAWAGFTPMTGQVSIQLVPSSIATNITATSGHAVANILWTCDGDSTTVGYGSTGVGGNITGTSYPAYLQTALGGPLTVECSNLGQSGQQATLLLQSRTLCMIQDGIITIKIAALWIGVNDCAVGTAAATTFAAIQSWHTTMVGAGAKTIAATVQNIAASATATNALINALNTLIRAAYPTANTHLADINANALLNDPTNTTYRAVDETHFTDAGYQLISTLFQTAGTPFL